MTNFEEKAELFKLLANPIRLQILDLLSEKPLSLKELTEKLKLRKPNVSQHLILLRMTKHIKVKRKGNESIYSLANQEIIKYL